ncbi:hypothetical protein Tco_0913952, partial [Tanacetum coccineum]
SIPCSPECKIVGLILLDHCLSHALTTTDDVPAVDTLHLPVETPENLFVAPANIHTIEAFMNIVGYQGVIDKKFPNIPKRIEEDYHYIKDDVPLVIEIRETDDFKEYETMFMKVAILMNQSQPVFSTKGMNRNTPKAHRSPTVSASPLEKKKRKQTAGVSSSPRKIIKQKKQSTPSIPTLGDDRERDAIAEASLLNRARESKGKSRSVSNDDETEKEKEVAQDMKEKETEEVGIEHNIVEKEVEDYTNVELERTKEVVKETKVANMSEDLKDNLSPATATTSKTSFTTKHKKLSFTLKTRNPPGCIAGMGRRRNLTRSHIKNKFITRKFFVKKIQEVLQHYDTIVLVLTVSKTNEMLKKEMPRLVQLAVNKDREVSPVDISGMVSKEFAAHGPKLIEELFRKHMQNTTLNLYPKTSSSTATTSSADLQQQLYLNMKIK